MSTRPAEIVTCYLPFNTPREKESLKIAKDLGFTSVQIYTFWRELEPARRGTFDWAALDRQVRLIQEAGLKFVPFLLLGPKYAAPDWWLADPNHVGLRCLEHDKYCPIESIWNPAFRTEITRFLEAFAAHYLPWNVLESVQPGICGDYGEAIFPAVGNWPGDYHTHRGFWCGGDDAIASFRAWLKKRYGAVETLNRAWRSHYGSFDEVRPLPRAKAPSRTAAFDLIAWYQDSMTRFSEFWMAECRRIFPDIPAYMCTGGADDEEWLGALFAGQAKAAAKHRGGIRLTNEVNKFDDNFRLTAHTQAACAFYGAYLGLEPVGPITAAGLRARTFGSIAFGNRQVFHYYGNAVDNDTLKLRPGSDILPKLAPMIGQRDVEKGIAFFWPVDQGLLESGMPSEARTALVHIRRHYPLSLVSEEMILDGALAGFGCLIMIGATTTRAGVLRRIAEWTRQGGRLLAVGRCRDIELEAVPEFDAVFGILPESEEACGHTSIKVASSKDFPKLSKIPYFHSERGWLGLAGGTEKIAAAEHRAGQSGTTIHAVSPLFRRVHGENGQAVFYCGPVNYEPDPERAFADPGVLLALLADMCAMSGVRELDTKPDEIARARVDGQMLILRHDGIAVEKLEA